MARVAEMVLAIALAMLPRVSPADADTAQQHFLRGEKILRLHIDDAEGGSREGVLAGISELEEALELGYVRAPVMRRLAQAYAVFASQHARGAEERAACREKARTHYIHYLSLRPRDTDARLEYLNMVMDDGERLRQLETAVKLTPEHGPAQFEYGALLVTHGNRESGVRHVLMAVDYFLAGEAQDQHDNVITFLRENGFQREGAEAERRFDARPPQSRPSRRR